MRIRDKGCGKPYGFRMLKGKVKGGCDFREAERTPAADGMELIYLGIQGRFSLHKDAMLRCGMVCLNGNKVGFYASIQEW